MVEEYELELDDDLESEELSEVEEFHASLMVWFVVLSRRHFVGVRVVVDRMFLPIQAGCPQEAAEKAEEAIRARVPGVWLVTTVCPAVGVEDEDETVH